MRRPRVAREPFRPGPIDAQRRPWQAEIARHERLTGERRSTKVDRVGNKMSDERYRVLVPQALGSDEFLRVTWHAHRELIVFSHWDGDHCVAALPVRITDIADLASLVAHAAAQGITAPAWPPPAPETLVVPAAGLTIPARLTA